MDLLKKLFQDRFGLKGPVAKMPKLSQYLDLKKSLEDAFSAAEDTGEFQDTLISVIETRLLNWHPTEQGDISRRADWQDFVNILIRENPNFN